MAIVVASIELAAPAAPWPAPHRLALVELEESIRILAHVPGGPLERGDAVSVTRDGDRYVVRPA